MSGNSFNQAEILRGRTWVTGKNGFIPWLIGLMVLWALVTEGALTVEVAVKPGEQWQPYPTRTLADLPASDLHVDTELSRFGGLAERKTRATGFFYATKQEGRWWLVDPEGCLFLHKGVSSVSPLRPRSAQPVFEGKFGNKTNWAAQTISLLRDYGFNGVGAWSDTASLRTMPQPLVYTRLWNFMSSYGKKRGGTYQLPGRTGYPNDCMFVFDPEFEAHCDEYAKQLASTRQDPWLLGHFSDNELPFKPGLFTNYLALPAGDPGHKAAREFLVSRHGTNATPTDITEQDKSDFFTLVADRYFRIVSRAIKKHDPNHLYLGSRLHGLELLRCPDFFKVIGLYVDVISVNYYRVWSPEPGQVAMWERESRKPVLITEWYAKSMDSGMANTGGAGWLVKTQGDRGRFYENFTLGLLESRVCVGWDWFKYADNDPTDTQADPSNRDSNKGILTNRYEPYKPLLDAMKQLNERAYSLAEYFDKKNSPAADTRRAGEKGD